MAIDVSDRDRTTAPPRDARHVALRPPAGSALSPLAGWLTAWGAASLAAACLAAAGVALGLGFGIADASVTGIDPGAAVRSPDFWPSIWMLVVQAGAFVVGGYVAGRMARRRGVSHAVAAWILAMLATGADAIIAAGRGGPQVIQHLGLPTWVHNGIAPSFGAGLAFALLALGSLIGAVVGGALAQAANRLDLIVVPAEPAAAGGAAAAPAAPAAPAPAPAAPAAPAQAAPAAPAPAAPAGTTPAATPGPAAAPGAPTAPATTRDRGRADLGAGV